MKWNNSTFALSILLLMILISCASINKAQSPTHKSRHNNLLKDVRYASEIMYLKSQQLTPNTHNYVQENRTVD